MIEAERDEEEERERGLETTTTAHSVALLGRPELLTYLYRPDDHVRSFPHPVVVETSLTSFTRSDTFTLFATLSAA
jgi:hypothetical protein